MEKSFEKHLAPSVASPPQRNRWRRMFIRKNRRIAGMVLLIVTAATVGAAFMRYTHQAAAVTDPFDAKVLGSMPFPLYYPTHVPAGYRIDLTSVDVPQPGVAVLSIVGPHNQMVYLSQEALVSTFDYSGYYKHFSALRETATASGVIAVGYVDDGRTAIGSLATSKTWIIMDTAADLPLSQLTDILEHLAVSH